MMKRVLLETRLQRVVGAGITASRQAGKTLLSPRKKAFWQLEPRVDRVKIVIEWIASAVNLGGIAEACLSSHMGRKAFLFFRGLMSKK